MAVNSIVVIKRGTMKIMERHSARKAEDAEKYRQEMLDKYDEKEYDIVVTYGGVFDVLTYLKGKTTPPDFINE
jgi:molybdopterin biosynthesis enzyme